MAPTCAESSDLYIELTAPALALRRTECSASIRDTVRAPYNTTSGRDCVKSHRLCLHGTCPQREGEVVGHKRHGFAGPEALPDSVEEVGYHEQLKQPFHQPDADPAFGGQGLGFGICG